MTTGSAFAATWRDGRHPGRFPSPRLAEVDQRARTPGHGGARDRRRTFALPAREANEGSPPAFQLARRKSATSSTSGRTHAFCARGRGQSARRLRRRRETNGMQARRINGQLVGPPLGIRSITATSDGAVLRQRSRRGIRGRRRRCDMELTMTSTVTSTRLCHPVRQVS